MIDSNTMPRIIITVPHRCVDGIDDNGCDKNAYEYAKELVKYLRQYKCSVKFITSRAPHFIPRSQCDLNRKQCRSCHMRNEVRKALHSGKKKDMFLFDIHTFPQCAAGTVFPAGAELVIMSGNTKKFAKDFFKLIKRSVPASSHFMAAAVNDIIEEAIVDFDVPAVLIEFLDSTVDVRPVAATIAKWCHAS